ncbi:MAG: glutaminase domain-containing protein [Paludibacteraceae bacterium]
MKKIIFILSILAFFSCKNQDENLPTSSLRAPAYPIINIDTYTNAWLFGDTLYNMQLSHWTGKAFPLLGAIRVDGESYRFMGVEKNQLIPLVVTSDVDGWDAKYLNENPSGNWMFKDYDDSSWKNGKGAFGVRKNGQKINTNWTSEHIWVRREFLLQEDIEENAKVFLEYSHDDNVVIYINGIPVIDSKDNCCHDNVKVELSKALSSSLLKGKNIIAAYCQNTGGDGFLDFGLSIELQQEQKFKRTALQRSVEVLPTQTIYNFECGPIILELTFTAPLLLDNLELLSRPVNYISYKVFSNDSKSHNVSIYLEGETSWALNVPNQPSITEKIEKDNLLFLKTGSQSQHILGKKGDDVRIDWGYFHLCAERKNTQSAIGDGYSMRKDFDTSGTLTENVPLSPDKQDKFAFSRELGSVRKQVNGFFMLGYDDLYSIQYFGQSLRPYWNRTGDKDIFSIFSSAAKEYKPLKETCNNFDYSLMSAAIESGGQEYAELCALAYRQTVSAHKLVQSPNGELLFLSKENYSSGSIATVDVAYPSSPLFLLYNVDLVKGMLNPIFYYVESGRWDKKFAPHDVGLYPIAGGQISEIAMPVEESGNMLILTAAIATMEGNAGYAQKHWTTLSQWADFLVEKGFDPDYQENTDIFTGHSAHNANLSIKGILGIASYGRLADMLGYNDKARKYASLARTLALQWVKETDDGDHYRFAFDQPDTWSQKYNLVWDKILKINVFPHEVIEKEIAFYLTKQNKYGLPLDSKHLYTKADWIVWSATLARSTSDFQLLISPLYKFVNETTDRIPMSDWYWTDKPQHVAFRARSVTGGFYIKMMEDKVISQRNQ